jgi:hypothetical protein
MMPVKIVLAIMVILMMFAAPVWAAEDTIVQQLSANGSRNTRPFTVRDRWEIRWDNKGPMLNITVRSADGKALGGGAFATAPGVGQSFEPKGGTYYLDISGSGEWTVTVVQLP